MMMMMMTTTNNNNNTTSVKACEGSEGSECIRRCATTFFQKKYNDFEFDKRVNKHKFIQNESIFVNKSIENSKTHIEIPSQPSHPHICAQLSVRVFSVPSQPSHSSIINNDTIVSADLDFILSHFEEEPFLFPRKISTYKSNNKQFLVRTREEVIDAFADSNFVDCRINAYPYLTEYKGIQRHKPNFIFIDLDRNLPCFKSDRSFENALSNTLKNIKEKLDGSPTVLETGGGYHFYQPIFCPTALENVTEFQSFGKKPSQEFLRFAKDNLSNGKADKQNNPSFRSCLLRIPGSINSKYNTKIKIIQKWNGYRPPIPREFLEEFRTYLIQKKIEETKQRQKIMLLRLKRQQNNDKNITNKNYYEWIDKKILANPFEDYRKIIINLILAPYLIVIRKLSFEESYQIINEWLQKCDLLSERKLDFNARSVVNTALATAYKKQIPPMSIITLKTNYKDLYFLLEQKGERNEKGDN